MQIIPWITEPITCQNNNNNISEYWFAKFNTLWINKKYYFSVNVQKRKKLIPQTFHVYKQYKINNIFYVW